MALLPTRQAVRSVGSVTALTSHTGCAATAWTATEAALATGADVVDVMAQRRLPDGERAMALTSVPLNSALLAGG
ncbi:hypothetical protein OG895_36655 [Streptomyces sp. NBC_00201]|uniref:hypothetical protein n=1 Tax=unclassified Streptomyces TaxID=2593676 RepID=UPI002253E508|nr:MULTISPECIES: hypothetical protein [unclassified Streptomyces]MCX4879281.1 hypothetical protein [Streptomyces sp. NBC_00847]MCX5250668.1 hypothetical protein [Streptomyces sp. NBC_00201]MCX5291403.1 hypothetical protein [Streptomyces sp. NBC_00183]